MCTNVRLYFLVRILRGCLFPVAVYECASWNILQSLKKNHIVTLTHLLLKVLLPQSHYSNFFFFVFTECCLHRKICCHDKLDHFFKFLFGSVDYHSRSPRVDQYFFLSSWLLKLYCQPIKEPFSASLDPLGIWWALYSYRPIDICWMISPISQWPLLLSRTHPHTHFRLHHLRTVSNVARRKDYVMPG